MIGWVSSNTIATPTSPLFRLPTVMPRVQALRTLEDTSPSAPAYLLYPASRYRGGGLIEDATINGVMLTSAPHEPEPAPSDMAFKLVVTLVPSPRRAAANPHAAPANEASSRAPDPKPLPR